MPWSGPLEKLDDYRYKVPMSYKSGMRSDGIVYMSSRLVDDVKADNSLDQVANMTFLPGLVGNAEAMPDIHWGYGFPIGGVAATDFDSGVVSPGGVGFDINCGVRLVRTNLTYDDIKDMVGALVDSIFENVPSGLGSKGQVRVGARETKEACEIGARWAVEQGYGWKDDVEYLEEKGAIPGADPSALGERPVQRGMPQLGSLGSGNHFLEIQRVDDIYDEAKAKVMGITRKDQIMILIHTGSRGLGYQVCQDQLKDMEASFHRSGNDFVSQKFDISLPDRQLVCVPIHSKEGDTYIKAMKCAANYAWANRQMITHWIRESFASVMKRPAEEMDMGIVYDVAHNIAKEEEHVVDGKRMKVMVHRKGATRAFGPGSPGIPAKYSEIGQPVLIPGSMGTASYVLVGTHKAMDDTFGSTCHGAGRVMSRQGATRSFKANQIVEMLRQKGIIVRSASKEGIVEEAPSAYKDIDAVVETAHGAGISQKVVRLTPLGVVKG